MTRLPPARSAETSAGTIAFLDEGHGPPVLLLHGFPLWSWQWREYVPLLAARFRVIAPDLPGAGRSVPAEHVALDLTTQAAGVRELLAGLDIERFAVVAHGAGAGVAQLLALGGDGVDAMVLLDAATLDAWPSGGVASARARIESEGATPELVRSLVHGAIDAGALRRDRLIDDVVDAYADPYATGTGPARFVRVLEGLDGFGLAGREAELGAIEAPVLILWGEDDPVYPAGVGERLNEAMPSSTLGLLPGCGHFLPDEAAETIGPMIVEYLRARYAHAPHGHGDPNAGIVMLQLERRPPWLDLEEDERDDWFHDDDDDEEARGP
ncbi:MAG TPA: alpha/beta hydrolase [Actinomycetota bacterium]|nr:alpha/beta hydrolase [Actinomycetota bacterium]